MKIIIFLLICLPFMALGQGKQFNAAIKNGRSYGKFYASSVADGKILKESNVVEYAAKHNYILRNIGHQWVDRFGDKFKGVKYFEFLPKTEIPQLIYEQKFAGTVPYKDLIAKSKVNCYFWKGPELFKNHSGFYWSGETADGFADGNGIGFSFDETKKVAAYVKGTFKRGVLQGEGTFATYTFSDITTFDKNQAASVTAHLSSTYNDDMAVLTINKKKGFISKNMNEGFQPRFSTIVEGYSNGKAIVLNDKNEQIVINKTGNFLAYSDRQKEIQRENERIRIENERIAREQEAKRQIELENQRRQQEENRRNAIQARERQINQIEKGDIICYSEDWQHSELFGLFRENYKMMAIMWVEDVTPSGKVILTVNSVNSSSRQRYSSMKFGRLEIKENQKISVSKSDMAHNNGFQFCQ